MPTQDRSNEFQACVQSIRNRSSSGQTHNVELRQRLFRERGTGANKTEFTRMADAIGKDIHNTSLKLNKLAQLAKRKTLFDDRPVEISELTYIIKQDIASLNKQIAGLQTYNKQRASQSSSKGPSAKQVEEHQNNVVVLLQNKLATTSITFKDVLELRTQNMKESKERSEKFMYSTASAASQPSGSLLFASQRRQDPMGDGSSFGVDAKGKGRAPQDDGVLALNLDQSQENGHGGNPFQQMQMMEQQETYIQSRSSAIEQIESTIAELGQIFSQLATMVAEQRETVQRIDADTMDIASNVNSAQRELLKYYASISSNRWLMLKVFGVLIVFFLVFILVS